MLKHMLNTNGVGRSTVDGPANTTGGQSRHQPQEYHRYRNGNVLTSPPGNHLNNSSSSSSTNNHHLHFPLLNISMMDNNGPHYVNGGLNAANGMANASIPPPPPSPSTPQPLDTTTTNSSKHSLIYSAKSLLNGGVGVPVNRQGTNANASSVINKHLTSKQLRQPHNNNSTKNNNNINNSLHRYHNNGQPYTNKLSGNSKEDDNVDVITTHPNVPSPTYQFGAGVKEMLISLGLLCLVSLLLALLSLIFLLKISPVSASDIREVLRAEQLTVITAEEYVIVYEVTLALCALTLSLNLCCLLVCAIQFLFAVKLIKSMQGANERTTKYLQKASVSRVCAVGGFFISIPVFLTGIILYTFIQFHSTPAIVTSVFIGLGIVFCGCAMVHNVLIWQREKTDAVKQLTMSVSQHHHHHHYKQQYANTTQFSHNHTPNSIHHQNSSFHNISAPIASSGGGVLGNNNNNSCVCPYNSVVNNNNIMSNGGFLTGFLHSTLTGSPAPMQQHTNNNSPQPHLSCETAGNVTGDRCTPTVHNVMHNNASETVALELSSVTTTNSPHELSTLV